MGNSVYTIPEASLAIHDIVGGNTAYLEMLLGLYTELFPKYTRYRPVMRRRAQRPANVDPRFVEHQWLVTIEGRPAAMTVFKYVPERNCGLGLDLGVKPEYKNCSFNGSDRLSKLLTRLRLEQLATDAEAAGRPIPIGMVVEVESPRLFARFCEYGCLELPVEYYEPPFIAKCWSLVEKEELEQVGYQRMHLGIYPSHGRCIDVADPALITAAVLAYLVDHYGLPVDHWTVDRALNALPLRT